MENVSECSGTHHKCDDALHESEELAIRGGPGVPSLTFDDFCLCFSFVLLVEYFRRVHESSAPEDRVTGEWPEDLDGPLRETEGLTCSANVVDEPFEHNFVEWRSIGMVSASTENRMLLTVEVNDNSSRALLDSGARFSMIHSEWLEKLGVVYDGGPEQLLYGFGVGNRIRVVGAVSLSVQVDNFLCSTVNFKVVASAPSVDIPVILASDFLTQQGIQIELAKNMVGRSLEDGGRVELYLPTSDDDYPRVVYRGVSCYSLDSMSINSANASRVPVRVSDSIMVTDSVSSSFGSDCVFWGNEDSSKICYMSGLVAASSNFSVLAIGVGGDSVVHKGDLVGTLCTTVVIEPPNLSGEEMCCVMQSELEHQVPSVGERIQGASVGEGNVTDSQRESVRDLLLKHEAVFSVDQNDVGMIGTVAHRIELLDDTPIYQKPRRLPEPIAEEIDRQCAELQLADIIEPSISPWSSPVVPVRKKDGSIRLCVDYRRLNAVTRPVRFPLPNLTDAVFGLHGVKYFTSLDLVRGYYQLPLHEDSREYTAFSTPHGHFQFKRLSFGLTNAPAAFQSQMQSVLASFPRSSVIVYIDDVLIMSRSFDDHLALVEKVLVTLSSHGIKIKFEKCCWFVEEVEYLGHRVSGKGIRKSAQFVQKVSEIPVPTTVRQLREFLGLVNFQRKFVPHFSSIQKPLTVKAVGRSNRRIVWTDEMDKAFEELKQKICEDVMLSYPDYSPDHEPLELFVDASGTGGGACLCQKQGDLMRVIAYASMSFNRAQLHYSTIERELCSLRWGVKTFRPFLIGMEFVVHTDHQPLIYLNNMKLVDTRLARTLEDLSDYNFEIRYTPGRENAAADCLSRLYVPPCLPSGAEGSLVPGRLPADLYVAKEVPGGGEALFVSLHILSERVKLGRPSELSPHTLRLLLVDDLLKNPTTYGLSLNRSVRKNLKLMRFSGQLPCIELLFSFGRLFSCVVFVHYGGDGPVLYVPPGDHDDVLSLSRVHLQCLAGVHFNPVCELPSYKYAGPFKCLRTGTNAGDASKVALCSDGDQNGSEDVSDLTSESINLVESKLVQPGSDRSQWCRFHNRTHLTQAMVNVQGRRRCALVDTGAQVSCISREVCIAVDFEINSDTDVMLVGFGGIRRRALGSVKLAICLDGAPRDACELDFVVVEDEIMPFCLILGADYLSANGISLDFSFGSYVQNKERFLSFGSAELQSDAGPYMVSANFPISLPQTVKYVCLGSREQPLTIPVDHSGTVPKMSSPIAYEEVRALQQSNRQLRTLRGVLGGPEKRWPRSLKQFQRYVRQLSMRDGLTVYRLSEGKFSFVVSHDFLVEFTLVMHHQMAHLGRNKLINAVKEVIWHPKLAHVAGDVSRTCEVCQKYKTAVLVTPPVHKIVTSQPFELVAADLISLPSCAGFVACLVVCDHYSKWMVVAPLRNKTSTAVAMALEHHVLQTLPRCPVTLLTDNGPEFRGAPFRAVLDSYGIIHQFTTPNKPSSNGLVERANRTLQELLRVQCRDMRGWSGVLPKSVMTYNWTAHSALGCSPGEFLLASQHEVDSAVLLPRSVRECWREGHPSFGSFKLGQLVLRRVIQRGNCTSNKFLERFEGPYLVTGVHQNQVTYQLEHTESGAQARAHHVQLRAFHRPPRYLSTHPSYDRITKANFSGEETQGEDEWNLYGDQDSQHDPGTLSHDDESSAAHRSEVGLPWVPADVDTLEESDVESYSSVSGSWSPCYSDVSSNVSIVESGTAVDGSVVAALPPWDEQCIDQLLPRIDFPLSVSDAQDEAKEPCSVLNSFSGVVLNDEIEFWEVSPISFHEDDSTVIEESDDTLSGALSILNKTIESLGPYWGSSNGSTGISPVRVRSEGHGVSDSWRSEYNIVPTLFWDSDSTDANIRENRSIGGAESGLAVPMESETDPPLACSSPIATRSSGAVADLPYVMPRVLEYRRRPRGRSGSASVVGPVD